MNLKNRRIIRYLAAVLLILGAALPLSAQAGNVRIRTIAGMEPIGKLKATGYSSGSNSWSTGYGFTPGLEVYYMLSSRIEVGAGFKWELDRRVFREGGSDDERFSFIPIYVTTRIDITEMEGFTTYALLKLGYAIFQTTQGFRDIWTSEPGGALTDTGGGIYASAALGVSFNLTERPKWGLDFSMDAGYAFHSATGKSATSNYPISYQAMSVDLALDWRL